MLLSLADGRRGLVTVAKQLTRDVVSGQRRVEDIIPSHVDTVIQGDDATTSNSATCFCHSCLIVYNLFLYIINVSRGQIPYSCDVIGIHKYYIYTCTRNRNSLIQFICTLRLTFM